MRHLTSYALIGVLLLGCGGTEPGVGLTSGGAGQGGGTSGASTSGQGGGSADATSAGAGGSMCPDDGSAGGPSGATVELSPGMSLASALAGAKKGDRVLVHAGQYPSEEVQVAF